MFSSKLVLDLARHWRSSACWGPSRRRSWTPAAQAQDEKPVIRYVFKFSSTWWPPEIDAKIRAEADELGVDYQVVGPENGDIAEQVAMIENFVSQKVDVLAVSSLGPATCQAIDDAIDAGIKVVHGRWRLLREQAHRLLRLEQPVARRGRGGALR